MPRAGLSRIRVVDEAQALSDEVGFDGLTLAGLASRVGVKAPSLYKHVEGLDQVRRDLAVRAKTELVETLTEAAAGRQGQDAVLALALAYRRFAVEYRARYVATVRAPDPADEEDVRVSALAVGIVFDTLRGAGVPEEDLVDVTRGLRAGMHGFIELERLGAFALPDDVEGSFERMVRRLIE